MNLSRERKLLIGVLGAGLGALLVDQLFLGAEVSSPDAASAGTLASSPADSLTTAAAPLLLASLQQPAGPSIARQLEEMAEQRGLGAEGTRDAFVPSASWVGAAWAPTAAPGESALLSADGFRQHHLLTGVMASGANSVAVINDRPVRLGRTIRGFTLVQVTNRSAVFDSNGTRVELKLSTDR